MMLAAAALCLLASEKPMVEARLFFGRDIASAGQVSERQWSEFAASVIAKDFPDGFTVSDGDGQWRNPRDGAVVHEPSKIVLVVAKRSPALANKLKHVSEAYRAQFHQEAVGVITREVCAAF